MPLTTKARQVLKLYLGSARIRITEVYKPAALITCFLARVMPRNPNQRAAAGHGLLPTASSRRPPVPTRLGARQPPLLGNGGWASLGLSSRAVAPVPAGRISTRSVPPHFLWPYPLPQCRGEEQSGERAMQGAQGTLGPTCLHVAHGQAPGEMPCLAAPAACRRVLHATWPCT